MSVILPVTIAVFLLLISVFEWQNYQEEKDKLLNKLETLSSAYSLLLAEPLNKKSLNELGLYSVSLISDPDIDAILIQDNNDNVLEKFGSVDGVFPALKKSLQINYADEDGFRVVGNLTLAITEANILENLGKRVFYEILLLVSLVVAVIFGARLAYRFSVGRPLNAMIQSIRIFESEMRHVDVQRFGDDELGQVIDAYNEMQRQRVIAEDKLLDYQGELELQVKERTGELTDEVKKHRATSGQLFEERHRAEVTLNSIADAVITTDTDGVIWFVNPAACLLLDLNEDQVLNKNIEEVMVLQEIDGREKIEEVNNLCVDGRVTLCEMLQGRMVTEAGSEHIVEILTNELRNNKDQIIGVSIILKDITESRQLSAKLAWQATHDSLTGLINRREFEHQLHIAIQSAQDGLTRHVLLFLDLDHFKVVNDTCGHTAGDELLRQLTALLQDQSRKTDVLARLGGDEFGLLMLSCSLGDAKRETNALLDVIRDFQFAWEDNTFRIGCSVGMVEITGDHKRYADIMKEADSACFMAKDAGRNQVSVYDGGDADFARHYDEMDWVHRIDAALAADRFVLYAQPVVAVEPRVNEPCKYEILVRMLGGDNDIIPPDSFLPSAERYNKASRIDRWVVRNAINYLNESGPELDSIDYFSINLSGQSMTERSFLDFAVDLVSDNPALKEKLCFEVTETAVIGNLTQALQFMETLRGMGVRFALDDFGSGLSSFGYLKTLPIDYIKIDGQFVKDICTDTFDRGMVQAISDMSDVVGKETIAEYVENDEILALLKDIGVDYAQGYGICMPEPLSTIINECYCIK